MIGAGWAGLAAAVAATQAGVTVVLSDMARAPGGRAREILPGGRAREILPGGRAREISPGARALDDGPACDDGWDNGQHILIGAYSATLALMRLVGAPVDAGLLRGPLALRYPDGGGLQLPAGAPLAAFGRGVLATRGWSVADKAGLLWAAVGWLARGFRCPSTTNVAQLCARLPARVQRELIEPLCVAALNTTMAQASGQVFLRVLHDALFSGRHGADLLLPRVPLSALLPAPATRWLQAQGADCRWGRRTMALAADGDGWWVDGEHFDAVVLACTASEAARLTSGIAPRWSQTAAALRYEPILTVYLHDPDLRLAQRMTALRTGSDAPAQFVFDLGQLGRAPQHYAFVVSGARDALSDGVDRAAQRVLAQARLAFPGAFAEPNALRQASAERRATFACTPGLQRPGLAIAPGLVAAGDYVAGPYPATLEGAVRAGQAAVQALLMA